jgi:hypothetical protein
MVRTIRLGTFSPSVLLEVARATGALAAAGLTVDEFPAVSSAQQFTDLFEGRLDAAFTNPDNVLAYRCVPDNPLGRTGDVRILGAVDRGLGLALFTGPDIDLVGTFGVDVPGSGFAFIGYELLARAGLTRDMDYQVKALGATPRRARALIDGTIDSTVLNAGSDLLAENHGASKLAAVTEIGPYVGTVLAATGDSVARNSDALSSLLNVIATTNRHTDVTTATTGQYAEVATTATEQRPDATSTTTHQHTDIATTATEHHLTTTDQHTNIPTTPTERRLDTSGTTGTTADQYADAEHHFTTTEQFTNIATAAIERRLGITGTTAARYLAVLTDPAQGLVADGVLTNEDLATVVDLRNRHARSTTTLTVAGVLASGLLDVSLRQR